MITAHEAWNHNQYRYVFTENGHTYSGLDHAPHDTARLGEQLPVFFDPESPNTNSLNDFSTDGNEGPLPLLLFNILFVVWAVFASKRKARVS